jgi:hypothetical protein
VPCGRPRNLLLLDITLSTTSHALSSENERSSSSNPTEEEEEFDPCAAAREELQTTLDTRDDATNVTLIDNRLAVLSSSELLEQQTEALSMEIAQKTLVKSKQMYEGEAGVLHAEMQVVGSCSEAAHIALFHAFESRQRGDPLSSQSVLLNLATDRVECAEKKLTDILPLREKVLKLRAVYKSDESTAGASEKRVRTLIEHQFSFAHKACGDLERQAEKANQRLLSVLTATHGDAQAAAAAFKATSVMDDNLMLAVQKGNVAAAQAKVFHEALLARTKTTCQREQRLKDEIGTTSNEAEAAANDPYENVDHESAMRYPEVDRLRGELNGMLTEYSKARENANLAEASFAGESHKEAPSAASGPAEGASGASGPAEKQDGPAK